MNKLPIFFLINALFVALNIIIILPLSPTSSTKPHVVIVFVIDQLSQPTLLSLNPYLNGFLRTLLDNGIRHNFAYWPHSMPATAPGHASLATGTTPNNHGIVRNSWINNKGTLIASDDDTAQKSAVFSPDGFYAYGKSPSNIMVDTLSDQLMLVSTPEQKNAVFAISGKSRSAIPMGGKCGKACWFDQHSGTITSSAYYFKELPPWLVTFNENQRKNTMPYTWNLVYPAESVAYSSPATTYAFSRSESLIGSTISPQEKKFSHQSMYTPYTHDIVLSCAQEWLTQTLKNPHQTLLLWVGLSGTDKVGHIYGIESREYKDMLYHLDKQLQNFMSTLYTKIAPEKVLILLTADHGAMPIVESLHEKGYTQALRLNIKELRTTLNKYLKKKHGIENVIRRLEVPDLYLNHAALRQLTSNQKDKLARSIKKFLTHQPGIKKVWTYRELNKMTTCDPFVAYYKNQLYPGRSGDIIIQVFPYVYASGHPKGSGHKTPYDYDTHVPLIMYQPSVVEKTVINDKVYGQQIAPTLAHILGIAQPSCCTYGLLPGIFADSGTPEFSLKSKR